MTGEVVVVGDTLLDRDVYGTVDRVCPDAPAPVLAETEIRSRAGGAGLAACEAASMGAQVTLVTALGEDHGGAELARLLDASGVRVVDLGLRGRTPEKIRLRSGNQSLLRLDRASHPSAHGKPGTQVGEALAHSSCVLVSDYGGGLAASSDIRRLLHACDKPLVWDPHRRGAQPVQNTTLATPNHDEVAYLVGSSASDSDDRWAATIESAHRALALWKVGAVVVTLGASGAVVVSGDSPPLMVPAPHVTIADVCGAGDHFAAATSTRLARGALPSEAVIAAVESAARFVSGMPSSPSSRFGVEPADPAAVVGRIRANGGTVVATGGCFDVLHAGHVAMLTAARRLGDCLVVYLNSDASVTRLKGPARPVTGEADRRDVLEALQCVDAVVVFDEDTPEAALRRLRPDLFVKGADYGAVELPEETTVQEWGGRVVLLPYLDGRSTTELLGRTELGRR